MKNIFKLFYDFSIWKHKSLRSFALDFVVFLFFSIYPTAGLQAFLHQDYPTFEYLLARFLDYMTVKLRKVFSL